MFMGLGLGLVLIAASGCGSSGAEDESPSFSAGSGGSGAADTNEPGPDATASSNGGSSNTSGTGDMLPPTTMPSTQPPAGAMKAPGVVIVDQGVARCAPLCTMTLTSAADMDAAPGDGWNYENND